MPTPKLYLDACCIIESLKGDLGKGAKEFITWDNRLGKKVNKEDVSGLRLIEPSATESLPNEYRSNDLFEGG